MSDYVDAYFHRRNAYAKLGLAIDGYDRVIALKPDFMDAYNGKDIAHVKLLLYQHGYIESFNGKVRVEFLYGEIFYILKEAKTFIAKWRMEYNTFRPHSSLKYRPPAPEAYLN